MKVYISYSTAAFIIHTDPNCPDIKKEAQDGQRVVIITPDNLSDVLQLFIKQNWKFASTRGKDDLWLDLTLGNAKLEESFSFVVRAVLSSYYKPFASSRVIFHC